VELAKKVKARRCDGPVGASDAPRIADAHFIAHDARSRPLIVPCLQEKHLNRLE